MSSTFICEKCNNTSFEQITYTQARCLQCGYLNWHDSGYKGKREFELSPEKGLLTLEEKVIYIPAPIIKRFVNRMVDLFIISFIAILCVALFTNIDINNLNTLVKDKLFSQIILVIVLLYYSILEFVLGKTIGKFITKTKVVSTNNSKLTFLQCLLRSLLRDIIPFEFITILLFKTSFLHDILPKTMVIED